MVTSTWRVPHFGNVAEGLRGPSVVSVWSISPRTMDNGEEVLFARTVRTRSVDVVFRDQVPN